MKSKAFIIGGVVVSLAAALVLYLQLRAEEAPARQGRGTDVTTSSEKTSAAEVTSEGSEASPENPFGGPAPSYPLNLEALRPQIPNNRYWELDAPTQEVGVAKQRAARAKKRNDDYGRILANEAEVSEIRAYYDERRRVSTDYLELTELVLAGKAGELTERDRGLFELSANLHRERLKQIERDQAAALDRRAKGKGPSIPGGPKPAPAAPTPAAPAESAGSADSSAPQ